MSSVVILSLLLSAPAMEAPAASPARPAEMAPAAKPMPAPVATMATMATAARPAAKPDERVPASTLVMVAYVLIWGVLLGYVLLLARRQRRLDEELAELHRRLDSLGEGEERTG